MRVQLPLVKNRNIAIFYFLAVANGTSFIVGNWIFFWTRFMTYGQLGLVDGVAFAFGLVLGIPTGAVADIIGKKKTVVAAMFLSAFGILCLSLSSSMMAIFLFFLLWQMGMALYAGASEALAYDTLVDAGQEEHFDQVIATSVMISIATGIVGALIGAGMYELHFRLPHFAWGVAYGFGMLAAFYLIEPTATVRERFSWRGYVRRLREGVGHLFQPVLRRFLPMIFTLSGVNFLYSNGFVAPAIAVNFGFGHEAQSAIFSLLGIIAVVILRFVPWMRSRIGDAQGLALLSLLLGVGFLSAAFPIGYYGVVSMLAIGIAGKLTRPWVSVVVNKHLESRYRATALSVVVIVAQVPYVVIAIMAGQLVEQGHLPEFNFAVGVLVVAVAAVSVFYGFRRRKTPVRESYSVESGSS